jgi:hypothetical protein
MSLFTSLLHLKSDSQLRVEDFCTEIVAQLFRSYPALIVAWLRSVGIDADNDSVCEVQTQVTFRKLPLHDYDSRPDMMIVHQRSGSRDVILVESKIGATEHQNQLRYYAEHLHVSKALGDYQTATLVFITRNIEGVDSANILQNCHDEVRFLQQRWYEVYGLISSLPSDAFITEVLKFMAENRIDMDTQFSPLDILVLTNFPRVRRMMDETLLRVRDDFIRVAGAAARNSAWMTQLQWDRYIMYVDQNDWWLGIGYFFNPASTTAYPTIGIHLEVNPSSKLRDSVLPLMRAITSETNSEWIGINLNTPRAWSAIRLERDLRQIMVDDDHLEAITREFRGLRASFEAMCKTYGVPWSKRQTAVSDSPTSVEGAFVEGSDD